MIAPTGRFPVPRVPAARFKAGLPAATTPPVRAPIRIRMPALYPKQYAAVFDAHRISCIEASTKAGKTLGCIVWQGARVLSDTRAREHWWVAPVFGQAEIAYRRVLRMFPREEYTANETKLTITFRNGARWVFKSAEKADNLYGEDVADAVIDEASRCREQSWYAIRSTLTATRGPLRIIGNVKGRKNWAYHLARKAEAGEPGMGYHKLTAWDAVEGGILAREEVEAARRDLPEAVFRELYLAEPSDDGGNPFGLEHIAAAEMTRDEWLAAQKRKPVAWGIDLAKSVDWAVAIGLDPDGDVCRFERWQGDWEVTLPRILDLAGEVPGLVDSTGVGNPVTEMLAKRSQLRGYLFSATSKQHLMEGLAVAIQQGTVRFPAGPIRSELDAFEYEYTRTGVRYSGPAGMHDDCVIALGLAVEAYRQYANRPARNFDVSAWKKAGLHA